MISNCLITRYSLAQPVRVSVRPLSNDRKFENRLEKSSNKMNDDLECQFCEALVKNVRVMLISNTTEAEFIQVLNGICKQTGTFTKEVTIKYNTLTFIIILSTRFIVV
jgi:hypothetical protein